MKERMPGEEMNPEAVQAFADRGYPIPGQSWTQPVDERRPFESAPDFVEMDEALNYTALELLDPENYTPIVLAIGDGVPVMDLALQMGYVGFREGKWNPDLMLMLLEPFAYLLMALAEKAGIKYRIDSDDPEALLDMEDGVADKEEGMLVARAKRVAQVAREKSEREGGVPKGALPTGIVQAIEDINVEGLLARQEGQQTASGNVAEEEDSLLARDGMARGEE